MVVVVLVVLLLLLVVPVALRWAFLREAHQPQQCFDELIHQPRHGEVPVRADGAAAAAAASSIGLPQGGEVSLLNRMYGLLPRHKLQSKYITVQHVRDSSSSTSLYWCGVAANRAAGLLKRGAPLFP